MSLADRQRVLTAVLPVCSIIACNDNQRLQIVILVRDTTFLTNCLSVEDTITEFHNIFMFKKVLNSWRSRYDGPEEAKLTWAGLVHASGADIGSESLLSLDKLAG